MLTKVEYLYRDGGNCKFFGHCIVSGHFDRELVKMYMIRSDFFVAETVGLPHLLNVPRNDDDHELHEIVGTESTVDGEPGCTADEMVARFKSASERGWFGVHGDTTHLVAMIYGRF